MGVLSLYRPFFGPYDKELMEAVKEFSPENIASAAQAHLEKMMCDLLGHYLAELPEDQADLMCAGGVFGNVKVTQALKKLPKVKSVYVQPQMGDGGLCLGAAALANEKLLREGSAHTGRTKPMDSVYLGPNSGYRDKQVTKSPSKVYVTEFAAEKIVNSLSSGKIIGLIQGRMEFGPRALCNRSIICRTSDPSINVWLNERMRRTEFMPFAPVLRLERAAEVIPDFQPDDITLQFMTATVEVSKKFKDLCPAVVHVDGTARPQIVSAESNPFIWRVLEIWEAASGELALVNTSFNAHEEPIVRTESEGLNALEDGIIDELWVSDDDQFRVYR